MANVPVVPNASVAARGGSLGVNAPRAAFGTSGEALASLGGEVRRTGEVLAQRAEQLQAVTNKVEADSASIRAAQRQSEYINKFTTENQGKNAQPNLAQAVRDLETIRNEEGANLRSPDAKLMFNSQTRIATAQATQNLSSFAARENLAYLNGETIAAAKNTAAGLSADNFDQGMAKLSELSHQQGAINGWGDEQTKAAYLGYVGGAAYSVTASMAAEHPGEARAFFEKHKELMEPGQRLNAESLIHASEVNHLVYSAASDYANQAAVDGAAAAMANDPAAAGYVGNVEAREGIGKNPYSSAYGVGQFTEDTWLAMMKKPEFANDVAGKTKAQILALRGNTLVGRKAIMAYRRDNAQLLAQAGVPVTDATLGLAHGYGPQGAIDILKAPGNTPIERIIGAQTAKNNRVAGKTTLQVALEFKNRFGSQAAPDTGQMNEDRFDAMEQNAPEMFARIAQDPRFGGDPVLIEKVQRQFLQNIAQERALNNMEIQGAMERLGQAAQANNITDLATLQKAYPNALEDWNALSAAGKRRLEAQLTSAGNAPTPERDLNWQHMYGGLMNPATASQYAHMSLQGMDLTRQQRNQIFMKQQAVLKKDATLAAAQQSVTRVLQMEPVKQAFDNRKDLEKGTPEYAVFTGQLSIELEEWAAANPGKKIDEVSAAKIANSILAKRVMMQKYIPGLNINLGKPFAKNEETRVTEEQAAAIRARYEPVEGPMSDFQVGRRYQEIVNAAEAKRRGG